MGLWVVGGEKGGAVGKKKKKVHASLFERVFSVKK